MLLRRILALVLALLLTVSLLTGCVSNPVPSAATEPSDAAVSSTAAGPERDSSAPLPETAEPTVQTEPPAPDPAALYAEAASALEQASDRTVKLTITEDRTVGGDAVTETTARTARYQGMDTEAPLIHVYDLFVSGNNRAAFDLTWADGVRWVKVKQARYFSQETLESFLNTQLPAVLLDPENYGSLTLEDGVLTFGDPLRAEAWAMPADGELREASASAVLTDGAITAADYEIAYSFGGAEIHAVYHADFRLDVDEDLSALVPEDPEAYTELTNPDAPILLYRAQIALENAKIYSQMTDESLLWQAADTILHYSLLDQGYELEDSPMFRQDEEWTAYTLDEVETGSSSLWRLYRDGVLSWQHDDDDEPNTWTPTSEESLTETMFSQKLRLFPDYAGLSEANLVDLGDYWAVSFTPTDESSAVLKEEACRHLFGDLTALDDHATDEQLIYIQGLAAFEKYTYLPVGLYWYCLECFEINNALSYLQVEISSAIRLDEPDTYARITEEPLPDEEPAEKPTPLLYEVTGGNGETMYLFGTVHLGDDRTAFLPQSLYDVFDSSDALAVESDTETLAGLSEEGRTKEIFRYDDGTTIRDHVEPVIYQSAAFLLAAIGAYTENSDQMKPFVWYQVIDEFCRDQGRVLTASKGADVRLMDRAREQGKEIREIESAEDTYEMLAGLSDGLQEMLLASALSRSRSTVLQDNLRLYELWCEGDEAALRSTIAAADGDQTASWTEDQRKYYEEYRQKMGVERNSAMLDAARRYLESGETVFFAVGILHLLGEGGLVDALREAGYTVTPVR